MGGVGRSPENGWGTLAAWSAGTENCRRQPRDYRSRTVRVTCVAADGTVQERTEPLTADDIEGINDDIESYLTDAGVPLPPRRFTWFIRLPPSFHSGDDFWAAFDREVYERAPKASTHGILSVRWPEPWKASTPLDKSVASSARPIPTPGSRYCGGAEPASGARKESPDLLHTSMRRGLIRPDNWC